METETIKCARCHGTGEIELVKSSIPSSQCKGCKFQALGSTQVKDFQQHQDLCRECRGQPLGLDREIRKDEICPDCKKRWGDH